MTKNEAPPGEREKLSEPGFPGAVWSLRLGVGAGLNPAPGGPHHGRSSYSGQ